MDQEKSGEKHKGTQHSDTTAHAEPPSQEQANLERQIALTERQVLAAEKLNRITGFGIAITVVGFLILAGTYLATKTTADAAKESADAQVATVRSWLGADELNFAYTNPSGKLFSPMFAFKLENLGSTPAKNITIEPHFIFDDAEEDHRFPDCRRETKPGPSLMMSGQHMPSSYPINDIPKEQFARLQKGKNDSVYAHLCIHYNDVLSSTPHVTEVCVRYFGWVTTLCKHNNGME